MSLETATYIDGLNVANPTATDLKSQGDDHLRLIKSTIKATFPNLTGAVTPTQAQLNQIGTGTFSGNATTATTAAACSGNSATANTASTLSGNWTSLPAGTRMPFAQAAAPPGWTQDTSDNANNRMLRVVSTAGGGVAGTHSPILNNVVPSHTHTLTTGNESATHTHGVTDPGHSHTSPAGLFAGTNSGGNVAYSGYSNAAASATNASATGISIGTQSVFHTHSGTTDNGSSQTNWAPRYIDMIICAKS
jgi:hypothetical protein